MLARNLFANYSGQVWTALMGFLFVPIYVRQLGVEAYGVIGLFGALIAWLALLDAGLKPALGREMARFTGGGADVEATWNLLRSVEILCIAISLLIAGAALASANWVASFWVKANKLSIGAIADAVSYMGAIAALRFIEGVYSSCLSGLQRHVSMNVVSVVMATVRSVGAVAVLAWVEASLSAFFVWQLVVSVLTVLVYWCISYRAMPVLSSRARFSVAALKSSWGFAGGMLMITFLALLLTQVDKILLSTLIPLEDFGRYTLASVAAGAIFTLISPISVTFQPRLTQLHAAGQEREFTATFHRGAQLVVVLGGSVAAVVIFHAEAVLGIWLHDNELARQTSSLLTLLLAGNLMNGLCHMPYQALLAHGITRLSLLINTIAALVLIPLIFLVVPVYGAIGAAAIWAGLNLVYLIVITIFVFRFLLKSERKAWILGDLLKPLLPCIGVAAVGRWLMPDDLGVFLTLACLALIAVLACLASLLISGELFRLLSQRLHAKPCFPERQTHL
jgi:O-antigen/teichoic acid export membrane protein